MATVFTLATGANTLSLTTGDYRLMWDSISIGAAALTDNQLSALQHDPVTFTVRVRISASSMATLWADYETLQWYVTQAQRWAQLKTETPVTLRYAPDGTSLASYMEVIIEDARLGVPVNVSSANSAGSPVIYDIPLTITRRGLLHGATETVSATTGTNPTKLTRTFTTDNPAPSLTNLKLGGPNDAGLLIPAGIVWASSDSSKLEVIQTNGMTTTGWTSVADAANYAWGNILRYTATTTAESTSGLLTTVNSYSGRVHVWAALRNTSSHNWLVRLVAYPSTYVSTGLYTRYIDLPSTGSAVPQLVYLGSVAMPESYNQFRLLATCLSSSGTRQLDFDYLVFMAHHAECYAIQYDATTFQTVPVSTAFELHINGNAVTGRRPGVYAYEDAALKETSVGFEGVAGLHLSGDDIAVIWAGMHSTYWRMVQSAAAMTVSLAATRRLGYLVPR